MKKPLNLPDFSNEDEVHSFMEKTDFSEYLEPSDLKPLNLMELVAQSKLKTKSVTIRLREKALCLYRADKMMKIGSARQSVTETGLVFAHEEYGPHHHCPLTLVAPRVCLTLQ